MYGGTDWSNEVIAKSKFLASMGYHIFLTMVLGVQSFAISHKNNVTATVAHLSWL